MKTKRHATDNKSYETNFYWRFSPVHNGSLCAQVRQRSMGFNFIRYQSSATHPRLVTASGRHATSKHSPHYSVYLPRPCVQNRHQNEKADKHTQKVFSLPEYGPPTEPNSEKRHKKTLCLLMETECLTDSTPWHGHASGITPWRRQPLRRRSPPLFSQCLHQHGTQ